MNQFKFVAKKYAKNIEEFEKDYDGYWAYAKKGYKFENTGCHTAHGYTQKEFLEDVRTLVECNCEECE